MPIISMVFTQDRPQCISNSTWRHAKHLKCFRHRAKMRHDTFILCFQTGINLPGIVPSFISGCPNFAFSLA